MITDSGSSVDIIDEQQWSQWQNPPILKQATSKIFASGSKQPINIFGVFESAIESRGRTTVAVRYM